MSDEFAQHDLPWTLDVTIQNVASSSDGVGCRHLGVGSAMFGNYTVLHPPASHERAEVYQGLLRTAARLFETRSVWFKAQTTVQHLQVRPLFPLVDSFSLCADKRLDLRDGKIPHDNFQAHPTLMCHEIRWRYG